MISGGRDKRVVMTELRNPEKFTVICEEKAPILKMVMTPDQTSIWVATSDSTINNWVTNFLNQFLQVLIISSSYMTFLCFRT